MNKTFLIKKNVKLPIKSNASHKLARTEIIMTVLVLRSFKETRGIIKNTLEPAKSFKGGSKESLILDYCKVPEQREKYSNLPKSTLGKPRSAGHSAIQRTSFYTSNKQRLGRYVRRFA